MRGGEGEGFQKEARVPEGHKLIAPIIFGYPTKDNLNTPPVMQMF
jgi:hypothetical protein